MPFLNTAPQHGTDVFFVRSCNQTTRGEVLICNFVGALQERYESLAGSVTELARFGKEHILADRSFTDPHTRSFKREQSSGHGEETVKEDPIALHLVDYCVGFD